MPRVLTKKHCCCCCMDLNSVPPPLWSWENGQKENSGTLFFGGFFRPSSHIFHDYSSVDLFLVFCAPIFPLLFSLWQVEANFTFVSSVPLFLSTHTYRHILVVVAHTNRHRIEYLQIKKKTAKSLSLTHVQNLESPTMYELYLHSKISIHFSSITRLV